MDNKLKQYAAAYKERAGQYLLTLVKWLVLSAICGGVCGLVGSAFHLSIEWATGMRGRYPWLLYCLPLAGLLIVAVYKLTRTEGRGTNDIIDEVHDGKGVPLLLLPAIFAGTFLTHLCGGSAGREGAALQMGGAVGYQAGRLLRFDDRDLRTATMAGMAAFFSALFGTPVAATVFAMTVASVGISYAANLLPSLLSAFLAYGVSCLFGIAPTRFAAEAPAVEAGMLLRVAVLGVLCALVSMLFCGCIHLGEHLLGGKLRNPWVRAVVGGLLVILLTFLCGSRDYNGAGMDVITRAVEQGEAFPAAFLLKILFTAVTLGAGFKGGEVVPSFFVGATFGCVAGEPSRDPGGVCGGGRAGGGLLRRDQLPRSVHPPGGRAVRRGRRRLFRGRMRRQLLLLGVRRPVFQPEVPLFQAQGPLPRHRLRQPVPRGRGAGGKAVTDKGVRERVFD